MMERVDLSGPLLQYTSGKRVSIFFSALLLGAQLTSARAPKFSQPFVATIRANCKIILLDLLMPECRTGLQGLRVLFELKELEALAKLKNLKLEK